MEIEFSSRMTVESSSLSAWVSPLKWRGIFQTPFWLNVFTSLVPSILKGKLEALSQRAGGVLFNLTKCVFEEP